MFSQTVNASRAHPLNSWAMCKEYWRANHCETPILTYSWNNIISTVGVMLFWTYSSFFFVSKSSCWRVKQRFFRLIVFFLFNLDFSLVSTEVIFMRLQLRYFSASSFVVVIVSTLTLFHFSSALFAKRKKNELFKRKTWCRSRHTDSVHHVQRVLHVENAR